MLPANTQVLATPEAVATEASRLICIAADAAIRERQVFRLVLAGGSTPRRTYELLAATAQDWAAWEIFWSDERCLPAAHTARNDRMAQETWLDRVAIPPANLYPIPVELGAEMAAAAYGKLVQDKQPFDLVLLGMGEDGHTASLFPGILNAAALAVAVHNAPKPPAERVSLGLACLRACRQQLVLVTGAGKAHALAAWGRGEEQPISRCVRSDAWLLLDTSLRLAATASA
jgi:6-phosphogluconolactonase